MDVGDIIKPDCIRSIRPGYGLPPKCLDDIIGKTLKQAAKKHTPVKMCYID